MYNDFTKIDIKFNIFLLGNTQEYNTLLNIFMGKYL